MSGYATGGPVEPGSLPELEHPAPYVIRVAGNERKSRAYAFLSDRTSQPDGSEWDHDRLRRLVDDLLEVI